jgi:transposase-like protein
MRLFGIGQAKRSGAQILLEYRAAHLHPLLEVLEGKLEKQHINLSEELEQAQKLGYAESNPSNDIDGVDAAYKLSIMATISLYRPIITIHFLTLDN